jgi:hypothetical protein
VAEALDRGGVSVDRIAFGPPINQGPAGYRIGVSQSGGVAAPLHNRRLATEICFASIQAMAVVCGGTGRKPQPMSETQRPCEL